MLKWEMGRGEGVGELWLECKTGNFSKNKVWEKKKIEGES